MSKKPTATKVKSYTGILNEPLLLGRTQEEQTDVEAFQHRAVALFKHYGIDSKTDTAWMVLALSLAHDHVPGFKYRIRKPGAPYKRADDDVTIYFQVKRFVAGDKSVNNACRIIEKGGFVQGLKASTIRQRYYDYRKEGKLGWHLDRMLDRCEDELGKDRVKEVFSTLGPPVVK